MKNTLYRIGPARLLWTATALLSLLFSAQQVLRDSSAKAQSADRIPTFVVKSLEGAQMQSEPRQATADVVSKALAFKALLSPAQQAELERVYTPALARRWSNLPCAGTCRNGIQLGSLTPAQLTAALEVIRAAAGTSPNEGSDEFNQIRLADTLLGAQPAGGGPAGAFSYGEGFYYLAFLNTPSTTGAWMLQYGGHHYGANISYNQGRVVATTPLFVALEPLTFTVNGNSYAPLAQERDALAAMLASLSSTQLASARLTTTFSDTTMSPGESNGGNGNFPATKVGLAVSSLNEAQKKLIMSAIQAWVLDMDDTVAANLMSIYEKELDATFVAFTGNGVAGDAASFLNANTNYVRIDGPSVWIEFVCQGGIIFRNQIHYHTVWRDHLRDYGKDLSLSVPLDSAISGGITATSAASYLPGSLAPESIATLFGSSLAAATVSASTNPLPSTLGNVQLQVRDAAGTTRNAPLFYVSPAQITFLVPAGTASGAATITVLRDGSPIGQANASIEGLVPGLFSANANGQGVAAAAALRVRADGSQTELPALQFNAATNRYEAVGLNLGEVTDQTFLLLFGTGFRGRSSLSNLSVTIGGVNATVSYAGPQGSLTGVDQANVLIPRSLAGRGSVDVVLRVDGKVANTVTIQIQ